MFFPEAIDIYECADCGNTQTSVPSILGDWFTRTCHDCGSDDLELVNQRHPV